MIIQFPGYDLSEKIYESRLSNVYRGRRATDGQAVVLKMLKDDRPSPERLAWFKREYQVTRALNLPGVIAVYALETHENRWAMVLEDFGAESLARLPLAGTIALPDFLSLALDITAILDQIHQQHIIHKDINSSNILLNPDTGQVKIIDFGISTVLSQEHQTFRKPDALQGTLAYISPEQTGRMNRALDYRTDFYSLGVTFYELLTGRLPYNIDDPLELVHAHIALQPDAPHKVDSAIPHPISSIIMKLMAKNAENRYQSAYGLNTDLEYCRAHLTHLKNLPGFPPGQHDISDRFQIPQRLYGREQERDMLMQAVNRCSRGAREVLVVTGTSGVGKSTLVHEVYKHITLKRGYFLSGKFNQLQRNIPYSALTQAFNQLCNMVLTEAPDVLAIWKSRILDAVGGNGQVLIDVIPRLELIIGPQPAVAEVGFQEAQNRFTLYFQWFMQAISGAEHPLIVFIDDLQWADLASLHLLRLLLTDPQCHHLLLIGAYRDDEVSSSHPVLEILDEIRQSGVTTGHIQLKNLRHEDVSALLTIH